VPVRRTAALLTVLALLVGFGVGQILRDTAPPELYLEVEEVAPSGVPLELFVSANEPVRYLVRYGALTLEEVGQDLRASLLAVEGEVTLEVTAEDGAGNRTVLTRTISGLAPPQLTLSAPEAILPGAALALELAWSERGTVAGPRTLLVDGSALPLFETGDRAFALVAVPLGTDPGALAVEASLADGYGRRVVATAEVEVLPDPQPVEELRLSAAVLSVSTPEGRDLERRTLEEAFSRTLVAPRWTAPFVLPLEGRGTSGYGSPRRYAAGGRVSYHFGADIAAPSGTPIVAANDAVVAVADLFPIKGGLVILDHGAGVTSLYFHQSRILVEPGQRVVRGQPIGEVGSTGLSSGPHLHWEIRVDGVPTDPLAWVDRVLPGAPPAVDGAVGGDAP
jgi:hypothetical protein